MKCAPAELEGLDMVLVLCAFGVLALAAFVILLGEFIHQGAGE